MAASTSDDRAASPARLYPERPFLAASVAVLRDGRVLLAARARAPTAGLFTLPGGLVEPGETLAEAALRELAEEVGIEAAILGFVAPVEVIGRDPAGAVHHHFVVCAHVARWVAGEPRTGPEAAALVWATPDDLAGLPTTPGLAAIVGAAFRLAAEHDPEGFGPALTSS